MKKPFQDVLAFHKKFGIPAPQRVMIPPVDRVMLRGKLIDEEYIELSQAIVEGNLIEIADGCADLIYVVIGTAIEYGIPLPEIWNAVQESNMQKVGGAKRADGKILKPDGWKPPTDKIRAILEAGIRAVPGNE